MAAPATATPVIVPDQFPTIQEALDSGANEILVRPGTYLETPVITSLWSNIYDDVSLRGLVPADTSPDSLPVIAGLVFDDLTGFYTHTPSISISDLRFSNPVQNAFNDNPYSNPLVIAFSRCVLDGGLNDSPATVGGQLEYELRSCTFDGPISLGYSDRIWIDSSLVRRPITLYNFEGGLTWFTMTGNRVSGSGPIGVDVWYSENIIAQGNAFEGYEIPLQVRGGSGSGSLELVNNTFVGPGRYGVTFGNSNADVSHNTFLGYEVGLHYDGPAGSYRFADNRMENCGIGMEVAAGYIRLYRDTILSCGAGAIVSATYNVTAERNVILSCDGDGMSLHAGDAQIDGNVVGRCGGDGIVATIDPVYGYESWLRGNSSYLNAGSGYVLALLGGPGVIDHNVGYGNGRHGLEVVSNGPLTIACNDWYANVESALQGIEPSTTDYAVDPLLCNLSEDDVHLAMDSPLANSASCGLIGALGIGCETTPVLVDQFMAWRGPDGNVVIGWRIRGDLASQVRVERAEDAQGPWMRVAGKPAADGPLLTIVDLEAESGRAYWYRLIEEDLSAGTQVLAMTFIDASAGGGGFGLEPTGGNPGPGPLCDPLPGADARDLGSPGLRPSRQAYRPAHVGCLAGGDPHATMVGS